MKIIVDDLTDEKVTSLICDHLKNMAIHSPPESRHALNIDALRGNDITFWSAWEESELMGCGALKELDGTHGEIKSMKTDTQYLRKGVSNKMLQHIIEEAKQRGYHTLSLETGSMDAFIPARKLYEKFGFQYCGPFADYVEDKNSVFMTKKI